MNLTISKSQFKPQALNYLRMVENDKTSIIITHFGKPVAKIVPHSKPEFDETLLLRDSVISYKDPLDPIGTEDWDASK